MERRKYERFETGKKYRAELVLPEKVKIKDISLGGICLKTTQFLNTNDIFRIEIISSKNEIIMPKGEVVWSSLRGTVKEKDETLPLYEVGIKFIELTDNEKDFLGEAILELSKITTVPQKDT